MPHGAVITTAALSGAEWDPSREILKVTVIAGTGTANTFKGVQIDSKFLKMAYSATGKASGLGPIPPVGGINSDWWKLAYVRQYLMRERFALVPTSPTLGSARTPASLPTFL